MTNVKFNNRPFEKSFNSFVGDLFTDLPVLLKNDIQWRSHAPVNIFEQDKNYSLELVAPGFDKADFKVNLDQNVLTISAEKKEETKDETKKHVRREYSFKSFKRSFTLDEKIDSSNIEAQYVNGVLTVNLPKKEIVNTTAKEINIK